MGFRWDQRQKPIMPRFQGYVEAQKQPLLTQWLEESLGFIFAQITNLGLAQKAGFIRNKSSQAGFARLKEAARRWVQQGRRITVQWVLSHTRIRGNEKADIEAKKHVDTLLTDASEEIQTLAYARRAIRQKKKMMRGWKNGKPKGPLQVVKYYQELKILPTTNVKAILEMNLRPKGFGLAHSSQIRTWSLR